MSEEEQEKNLKDFNASCFMTRSEPKCFTNLVHIFDLIMYLLVDVIGRNNVQRDNIESCFLNFPQELFPIEIISTGATDNFT